MHKSSYDKVIDFRRRFLQGRELEPLRICDLGSYDVNGTYRKIFEQPTWHYFGVDMVAGCNVDVVLKNPYHWREIPSASVDVLVSGQAFEHISFIWITMLEVARVLAPGGLCCIVAPSAGPEHRYPVDCWRIYPDGFVALAALAELEVIEVETQWANRGYVDGSDTWHDSVFIGRQHSPGLWTKTKVSTKRWLRHRTLTLGLK
jgi:SAM-dependent methyltransferase